jgi:flagellar hook-associated protein 3 FlgL
MRITQSMMTDRLLSNLSRSQERLARASEEMQTQKKLLKPSDDPVGAQRAVLTRGDLAANKKYTDNISQARGFMQTSGSTLDEITKLLHRAQELTIQGANGATGDEARKNIAAEIDQIADAVKQAGNTNYAGVYLFSGTATTTQPYDTTTVPAVDTYQGDSGVIAREIGPGVSVQINTKVNTGTPPLLGSGGGDGGLIDTLRTISAHLKSGVPSDVAALGTSDLKALDANLTTINTAQAVIGATVNRLDSADGRLASTKIASTQLLSDTEDIDAATAYLNLSTTQSVYEAALKAGATIIQPSLLDFLS